MASITLFSVSLLLSCHIQGTRAVIFVQKGKDLILDVKKEAPKNFIALFWNFNGNIRLVTFSSGQEPRVNQSYTGRVEFSVENYSVTLKNLQETDSGVYTAQVISDKNLPPIAEHSITVQDPVSPVGLTVTSVHSSSDSCSLTVSCSTQDSHTNGSFTCDAQTCRQEGGEKPQVTTSGASLHVYLISQSITCNHSNQVSWTSNITKMKDFCSGYSRYEALKDRAAVTVTVPVVILIAVLLGVVAALCILKRRNQTRTDTTYTEFRGPEVVTGQTQSQSSDNDGSSLSPTSTYSLVGQHTGPKRSTETAGRDLPDSLYAQVEKPGRSPNKHSS